MSAAAAGRPWGRYEELRPDALEEIVRRAPVAYWPLGLIEHHGWHLPVGFDGIKAARLCELMAESTGGLVLPVMWWGALGGHGAFHWTLYQEVEASRSILFATLDRLVSFGIRAVVLLAGHYPWERIARCPRLEEFRARHPEVLLLLGTEVTIASPPVELPPGDHAARQETSYGLALLPELVDLSGLRAGRGAGSWPAGGPPPPAERHPGVEFDEGAPLFAQLGEDARRASAVEGRTHVERIVAHVTGEVDRFLAARGG